MGCGFLRTALASPDDFKRAPDTEATESREQTAGLLGQTRSLAPPNPRRPKVAAAGAAGTLQAGTFGRSLFMAQFPQLKPIPLMVVLE